MSRPRVCSSADVCLTVVPVIRVCQRVLLSFCRFLRTVSVCSVASLRFTVFVCLYKTSPYLSMHACVRACWCVHHIFCLSVGLLRSPPSPPFTQPFPFRPAIFLPANPHPSFQPTPLFLSYSLPPIVQPISSPSITHEILPCHSLRRQQRLFLTWVNQRACEH